MGLPEGKSVAHDTTVSCLKTPTNAFDLAKGWGRLALTFLRPG